MQAMDMELIRFMHGHIGPWVVIGIKIGDAALKAIGGQRNKAIRVKVETNLAPPPSCMIDGLQLSTGATLGKRWIEIEQSDTVRVTIKSLDTNKTAIINVSNETAAWMIAKYKEIGDDAIGALIRDTPDEQLFTLEVLDI